MGHGFWAARQKVNEEVSLPALLEWFEQRGILDNFRGISGRKNADRAAAQEPGGYINTFCHELYCLGHLLQAGMALGPRDRR